MPGFDPLEDRHLLSSFTQAAPIPSPVIIQFVPDADGIRAPVDDPDPFLLRPTVTRLSEAPGAMGVSILESSASPSRFAPANDRPTFGFTTADRLSQPTDWVVVGRPPSHFATLASPSGGSSWPTFSKPVADVFFTLPDDRTAKGLTPVDFAGMKAGVIEGGSPPLVVLRKLASGEDGLTVSFPPRAARPGPMTFRVSTIVHPPWDFAQAALMAGLPSGAGPAEFAFPAVATDSILATARGDAPPASSIAFGPGGVLAYAVASPSSTARPPSWPDRVAPSGSNPKAPEVEETTGLPLHRPGSVTARRDAAPREVPPPVGADLITVFTPFDRDLALEESLSHLIGRFEDLGRPVAEQVDHLPAFVQVAGAVFVLEAARRWHIRRSSPKTIRTRESRSSTLFRFS